MQLNIEALARLVQLMPNIGELQVKLDEEMNKQKLVFLDQLKQHGLDPKSKSLNDEQRKQVESAQIEHAASLYKEMGLGLAVCAHDLEVKLSENPELKPQLSGLQQQISEISGAMLLRAQALTGNLDKEAEQARANELEQQQKLIEKQHQLDKDKEKRKELEKEKESVEQWKQVLKMILPEAWEKSWEEKAQQHLHKLEAKIEGRDGHASAAPAPEAPGRARGDDYARHPELTPRRPELTTRHPELDSGPLASAALSPEAPGRARGDDYTRHPELDSGPPKTTRAPVMLSVFEEMCKKAEVVTKSLEAPVNLPVSPEFRLQKEKERQSEADVYSKGYYERKSKSGGGSS